VQYLAASQLPPARAAVAAAPAQPQAQTETGNSGTRAQLADTSAAAQPAVSAASQPAVSNTQAAPPPAQPAVREQTAEDARVRDAEARRADAEAKRAMEKRKAERRQQWAERRRQRQQQELRIVEQRVREDTEPRQFAAEPVRMEMRLFGTD
jgi:hypothetical protein